MTDIIVYSSDTCPYCTALKDYLKEKNVAFTEKNITTDMEARKELMNMGHMGVPITIIDNQEIVGFDQPKLDQLLKL
ncbi:glutaredoxin family protein [Microaceticoccus formicicus]|uniref:glutaredoxin family protein n=1 Tax=Microaceticoccus formicicus TaxID=3118105 RepID=UPI003CD020AA|nr:glutaredoxin family protein [Peptoniphilaceae bacterium AMB_02]